MKNTIKRIFVEKKSDFAVESDLLLTDLRENLGIKGLEAIRIIQRYDVEGINDEVYEKARSTIFSDPTVDFVYDEELEISKEGKLFAVEYLPGQYDQRADFAAQCLHVLAIDEIPVVRTAVIIVLKGSITDEDFDKIKSYYINPVEMRETTLKKLETLKAVVDIPDKVEILEGFIDNDNVEDLLDILGLAMTKEDLLFCRDYFKDVEKRNPTITEIRVIDTYWSDHCRHTTFNTIIDEVFIEEGKYKEDFKKAFDKYKEARSFVIRKT